MSCSGKHVRSVEVAQQQLARSSLDQAVGDEDEAHAEHDHAAKADHDHQEEDRRLLGVVDVDDNRVLRRLSCLVVDGIRRGACVHFYSIREPCGAVASHALLEADTPATGTAELALFLRIYS